MKPGDWVRVHSGYLSGKVGIVKKLSRLRSKDYVYIETNCPMKYLLLIELKFVEKCRGTLR